MVSWPRVFLHLGKDWFALGKQTLGVMGGTIGAVAGALTTGLGVAGVFAPEPISTGAGLGLVALGSTTTLMSVDTVMQNGTALIDNVLERDVANGFGGFKEAISTEITGNPNDSTVSKVYDAVDLATGMANGRAVSKMADVPKSIKTISDVGDAVKAGESIQDSVTSIKDSSNSDRGMSGGSVHICSGMGAQKGGC